MPCELPPAHLSPLISQRSRHCFCCNLPVPDSFQAFRRTDCGTRTNACPGVGGHGWTPLHQLEPSSQKSTLHTPSQLPAPRIPREIAPREEPGTHLIFRLASIVLSILGREQRRVLVQAQGPRCSLGEGWVLEAAAKHDLSTSFGAASAPADTMITTERLHWKTKSTKI